jgi:hypothetical protein
MTILRITNHDFQGFKFDLLNQKTIMPNHMALNAFASSCSHPGLALFKVLASSKAALKTQA